MVKSSLAAAILLCVVLPLRASIQELEVKANYSGHDAAYSFGILQYRGYFDRLLAGNGHVYVDFDTEALYLQGGYNIGPISFGPRFKGHLADWQNLQFVTNENTGRRINDIEIKASYLMAGVYSRLSLLNNAYVEIYGQYVSSTFKPRSNSELLLEGGQWFESALFMGWYNVFLIKPGISVGQQASLGLQSFTSIRDYRYQSNPGTLATISTPRSQFYLTELRLFWGQQFNNMITTAQLNLGAYDFLRDQQQTDLVFFYSVGGPEARYRRLAGFAFSEFRLAGFGLLNLDAYIPLFANVYLWPVFDIMIANSKKAGSVAHAGSGLGFYLEFSEQSLKYALYLRGDYAITARRQNEIEKVQVFFGLSAFF